MLKDVSLIRKLGAYLLVLRCHVGWSGCCLRENSLKIKPFILQIEILPVIDSVRIPLTKVSSELFYLLDY